MPRRTTRKAAPKKQKKEEIDPEQSTPDVEEGKSKRGKGKAVPKEEEMSDIPDRKRKRNEQQTDDLEPKEGDDSLVLCRKKVASVLKNCPKQRGWSDEPTPRQFYQNQFRFSATAPRALFSAVEARNLDAVREILQFHSIVVGNDGILVDEEMWEVKRLSDDCHEELPFDLPFAPGGGGPSILGLALLSEQISIFKELWKVFEPKPKGNHKRLTNSPGLSKNDLILLSRCDLSYETFFFLIQSVKSFVEGLHSFARMCLRCGSLVSVRRCFRYMLNLPSDLDGESPLQSDLPLESSGGRLRYGLTTLHLEVLEISKASQFSQKLDEELVNAPALKKFITPLHLAAARGDFEIFAHLLKHGGDPTICDDYDWNAVHYSLVGPPSQMLSSEQMKMFTEMRDKKKKATPEPKLDPQVAASPAVKRRKTTSKTQKKEKKIDVSPPPEISEDFLDRMMHPTETFLYLLEGPEQADDLPQTRDMLEVALMSRQDHNVAFLVHFDYENASRCYPHQREDQAILKLIENGGSRYSLQILLQNEKFRSKLLRDKRTIDSLLIQMLKYRRVSLLSVLIEDEELGASPDEILLQHAVSHDLFAAVEYLIQHCEIPINSTAINKSPLHTAVEFGPLELIDFLIDHGACLTSLSSDGLTVLLHAARYGHIPAIELLSQRGVSLKDGGRSVQGGMAEEKEEESDEDGPQEAKAPFENWVIVLTGAFSVSKTIIKQVIQENGGRVTEAVNSLTTHCCYSGRDGFSEYGKKMGKGDKKYKEAKRKRLPFIDEETILREMRRTQAEAALREGVSADLKGQSHSLLLDVLEKGKGNKAETLLFLLDQDDVSVYDVDEQQNTALHFCAKFLPDGEVGVKVLKKLLERSREKGQLELKQKIEETKREDKRRRRKGEKEEERGEDDDENQAEDVEENGDEDNEKMGDDGDVMMNHDEENLFVNETNQEGLMAAHILVQLSKWFMLEFVMKNEKNLNVNRPTPPPDPEELKKQQERSKFMRNFMITNPWNEISSHQSNELWFKGLSLLQMLVYLGRKILVQFALDEMDGDPNSVTATPSASPLAVLAVQQSQFSLACWLLSPSSTTPKPRVDLTDVEGNGVIHTLFETPIPDPIQALSDLTKACQSLSVSTRNLRGRTPLHLAAMVLKQTTCLRHLLKMEGVQINEIDAEGNSALALAVINKKESAALFLVDNGADFNLPAFIREDGDLKQFSIYQLAMKFNMSSLLYVILHHQMCSLKCALQAAISTGKIDQARFLLQKYQTDEEGVSSGEEACRLALLLLCCPPSSISNEKSLLSLGSYLFPKISPAEFVHCDTEGNHLIHVAVKKGHDSLIIALLLDIISGRRIQYTLIGDNDSDSPPSSSNLPSCLSLTRTMSAQGIKEGDKGPSPAEAMQRVLKVFLTPDHKGCTVLHTAISRGLLKTSLHLLSFATTGRRFESAATYNVLVDNPGLSFINARNEKGETALHCALNASPIGTQMDTQFVGILRMFGADVTISNKDGVSVAQLIGRLPDTCFSILRSSLDGKVELEVYGEHKSNTKIEIGMGEGAEKVIEEEREKRKESEKKKQKEKTARVRETEGLLKKLERERKKMGDKKIVEDTIVEQKEKAKSKLLKIDVDEIGGSSEVYQVFVSPDGDIYDVMFHLTDMNYNVFGHNMFHSLQLVVLTEEYQAKRFGQLKKTASAYTFADRFRYPKYRILERWGRLGDEYPKKRIQGYNNFESAKKNFDSTFRKKTGGTPFEERYSHEPKKNAYNIVFKHYPDLPAPNNVALEKELFSVVSSGKPSSFSSDLSPETLLFLKLITNLSTLRQILQADGYDTEGNGFHALSHKSISKAYQILGKLEEHVQELERNQLIRGRRAKSLRGDRQKIVEKIKELSNLYYMTIPHNYGTIDSGMKEIKPLDNRESFQKEMELLRSMQDVEATLHFLVRYSSPKETDDPISKLTNLYPHLGLSITPIKRDSLWGDLISQYAMTNSSHAGSIEICEVLKIDRFAGRVAFEPLKRERGMLVNGGKGSAYRRPANMLLWHGTKLSNVLGVLLHGLQIAPPEAPVTGAMFGRGLYFADTFSKSSSYTMSRRSPFYASKSDSSPLDSLKVMLLCEVALGESLPSLEAEDFSGGPPAPYSSVQGCGQMSPSPSGMFVLKNGVGVPMGKVEQIPDGGCLSYNEFVVYDETRVQIRFAVIYK